MLKWLKRLLKSEKEEPAEYVIGEAAHFIVFRDKKLPDCLCEAVIAWKDAENGGKKGIVGKEPIAFVSLRETPHGAATSRSVGMEGRTMTEFKKCIAGILNGYAMSKGMDCDYRPGRIENELPITRVGGGYPRAMIKWKTGDKRYRAVISNSPEKAEREAVLSEKGEALGDFEARIAGILKEKAEIGGFRGKVYRLLKKRRAPKGSEEKVTDEGIRRALNNGASPEDYVAQLLF